MESFNNMCNLWYKYSRVFSMSDFIKHSKIIIDV